MAFLERDERVVGVLPEHAVGRGDIEVVQRDQPLLQRRDRAAPRPEPQQGLARNPGRGGCGGGPRRVAAAAGPRRPAARSPSGGWLAPGVGAAAGAATPVGTTTEAPAADAVTTRPSGNSRTHKARMMRRNIRLTSLRFATPWRPATRIQRSRSQSGR